jgi:hypothetical protein
MAQNARADREVLSISLADRKLLRGMLPAQGRQLAPPAGRRGPATIRPIRPSVAHERADAFRRDSRRLPGAQVPHITEVRIAGERLKLVDVSRHGLLLHGSKPHATGSIMPLAEATSRGAKLGAR